MLTARDRLLGRLESWLARPIGVRDLPHPPAPTDVLPQRAVLRLVPSLNEESD